MANTGVSVGGDMTVTGDVRVRMGSHVFIFNNVSTGGEAEAVWFNVEEPVPWFSGRKSVLEKLKTFLHSSNAMDRNGKTRCAVLRGPRGTGKGQVVAEFARREGSYYWNILRFSCVSITELRLQFATLAETKFAFQTRIPVDTLDGSIVREMKPTHELVEAVYSKALLKPSLIIFENVASMKDIADFLPRKITSTMIRPHIILTTCKSSESGSISTFNVRSISVDEFESEESAELLDNFMERSVRSEDYETLFEICLHHPGTLQLAFSHLDVQRQRRNGMVGVERYVGDFFLEEAKIRREDTDTDISDAYRTFYNLTTKSVRESDAGDFALKALEWASFLLPGTLKKEFLFALFEHLGPEIVQEGLAVLAQHSLLPTNSAIVQLTRERMRAEKTEVVELCEFLKAFRNVLSCVQNDIGLSNHYVANAIFALNDTCEFWDHAEVLDFAKFTGAHLKRFDKPETVPILKKIQDFEATLPPSAETSQTLKLRAIAERDRKNFPEASRLYMESLKADVARIGWHDPVRHGLELLRFGQHCMGPSHPDSFIIDFGVRLLEAIGVGSSPSGSGTPGNQSTANSGDARQAEEGTPVRSYPSGSGATKPNTANSGDAGQVKEETSKSSVDSLD